MSFEKTYPKPAGVGGYRPHVDVEFAGQGKPVAIESKFTEPYHRGRKSLKKKYAEVKGIWGNYLGCESLAESLVEGKGEFEYLDVPQLLKHALGLKTQYGERDFQLLYLWYDYPSAEAEQHRKEITIFKKCIEGEFCFRETTYQEIFKIVRKIPGVSSEYISYLSQRYFPEE